MMKLLALNRSLIRIGWKGTLGATHPRAGNVVEHQRRKRPDPFYTK